MYLYVTHVQAYGAFSEVMAIDARGAIAIPKAVPEALSLVVRARVYICI